MVMVHTGSTHKEEEAKVEAGGMDTAVVEEDVVYLEEDAVHLENAALVEEDTALVEQDAALVEEDMDVHVDMDVADLRHITLQQWYVKFFNLLLHSNVPCCEVYMTIAPVRFRIQNCHSKATSL